MAASFTDALDSLALIEADLYGIDIVSALPNEAFDQAGVEGDTVDVQFQIVGRPGVFTTTVPYAVNWNAIAFFYIGEKAQLIEQIYEGKTDSSQLPTDILVPQITQNPTPIPQPGPGILV